MECITIEVGDTWLKVDGYLIDLTDMDHWSQTTSNGSHSPRQDYKELQEWLDVAQEVNNLQENEHLLFRLYNLLTTHSECGYPSRFTIPSYVEYKLFHWVRHLKYEDTDYPPAQVFQKKYKRMKEQYHK